MLTSIIVLVILILLNAYFAATEIAFISLNDAKIEKQAKEGNKKAKQIEKIKEPFYTTKKNGTGLGVSLSIEIIKAHNGKIDYIPLKKGLKVIVELPIHELTSLDIN